MTPFDFLFDQTSRVGQPPGIYGQPPMNRRDAAILATRLPNAQAAPTPLVPPPPPQEPLPPAPPPQPMPQQQQQAYPNPLGRYDAMVPQVERPGFLDRLANVKNDSVAAGLDAIFGNGDDLYNARQLQRLELIQKLQAIDKGHLEQLGDTPGIMFDRRNGLTPDEGAWANAERMMGLKQKYARGVANGAGAGNGAEYVETMVDPQTGRTYRSYMTGGANGPESRVLGTDNKAPPPDVAERLVPASIMNTQIRGDVNFTNKQVEEIVTQADAAHKSNAALQSMRQTFQGAAAQGFGGDAQRWFMEQLGMDLGTLNVSDKQTFESATRMLEGQLTKQILGGQGQITEGERKIIRDMLPTLRTSPVAFDRIMKIYEGANQRAIAVDRAWFNYKDRLGEAADYSTFKRVLNAAKGRGDAEAYELLEQWSSDGNLNVMPDWVMAKPSKNAPKGTDGPLEVPPSAPPKGPASGVARGPNGQRYKWSREAPTSPILKGANPAAFQNTLPQPAPAPVQQPQSFRPGLQTGGVGGPQGMGPPPRENTFAPRFEGDPEVGVYSSAPAPQGRQSLLNTPRDRLIAASRASQRGKEFNQTATQAKEIAKLMKQLPRMSPTERAKAETYLKSLGVIQ